MPKRISRPENAKKFREICEQRNISDTDLTKMIGVYASSIHLNPKNVVMSAKNLRAEVKKDKMTDHFLIKILGVIGLSKEEIQQIVTIEEGNQDVHEQQQHREVQASA